MNIRISNPKEDQYGNSKKNIFIAFDDKEKYLGSAYAYPSTNYHQTGETPYLIFIDINLEGTLEKCESDEVRQLLFSKVILRARELRAYKLDLKTRIYSGFEYDKEKMNFYISNGFEEDYSIIMEAEISDDFCFAMPENIKVHELKLNNEEEFIKYKAMYDEIFVTPLSKEAYEEQKAQKHFKSLSFTINGQEVGGCTIFEKEGFGYVETLFVLPESRGKDLSKLILNYVFNYFHSKGLRKSKLEVWELNKRAVELYKAFGYKKHRKNLMFPGITL